MKRTRRRRAAPSAVPTPVPADQAAMFELIGTFSVWAQAADQRAGMVAAALGTIGIGVTGQGDALGETFRTRNPLALILLALLLVLVVSSGVLVVRVLTPRLSAGPHLNRASFVSVAEHRLAALRRDRQADLYDDLCEQAWILARIAHRKYRMLRVAVLLASAAALVFLCWTLHAASLPSIS